MNIENIAIWLGMQVLRFWHWPRFISKTSKPEAEQEALLLSIVRKNARTDFGVGHGFGEIRSYRDYAARVPVQTYEQLRPHIERQARTGAHALTAEQPIFYAQTSGTTSAPKLVPIVPSTMRAYRANQRLFSYALYASMPSLYSGKILALVSPAIEGCLPSGTCYGSMSGLNYRDMPSAIKKKYVVPNEVFEIQEYDRKYREIARCALAEKNVTVLASPNPSSFIRLLAAVREEKPQIESFADLWPSLQAVVTWTGGSAGFLLPDLKKRLPPGTKIIEMGYLSSEFRGTISLPNRENAGIPALHDVFFEFSEPHMRDEPVREFSLLHELVVGKSYEVFVTTGSGLYRYDMHDIIEVTGMMGRTPTIRFLQKTKGITSITGEKLYESQVTEAISSLKHRYGLRIPFFMMVADEHVGRYVLYLEHDPMTDLPIGPETERLLEATNIEYAAKRKSGRLESLEVRYLRTGTGEAYKRHKLRAGQRESQYKILSLQYKKDCDFDLDAYAFA